MKYELTPLPNDLSPPKLYQWYLENEKIISKIFDECYYDYLQEKINHFPEINQIGV